jgi:SAM-dependent methyltransferase
MADGGDPDLFKLIRDCLPDDHARQVSADYMAEQVIGRTGPGRRVLDLGCGAGKSLTMFRRLDPKVDWHGLDLDASPEVAMRTRTDGTFHSYDGVNIPFPDASFDLVFSKQVFEHVRHPDAVMREVARVLRPGGAFVGSVSALEPYHSFSLWNFTPYGWYRVLADAGLQPVEFRPSIDGVALIQRQYLRRPPEAVAWWTLSPMNEEIDAWGAKRREEVARINLRKLHYCGHLVFWAAKRDPAAR